MDTNFNFENNNNLKKQLPSTSQNTLPQASAPPFNIAKQQNPEKPIHMKPNYSKNNKVKNQNNQNPQIQPQQPQSDKGANGSNLKKLPILAYPLNSCSFELLKHDQVPTLVCVKHTCQTFQALDYKNLDKYKAVPLPMGQRQIITNPKNQMNNKQEPVSFVSAKRDIQKFYRKRYYLFSRFDEGILIDEEGWYSVTPEIIAKHIADRTKASVSSDPTATVNVMDAFVGVGGNLVQFAKQCGYCVGVDIDFGKCWYSANNAQVYGLQQQKDFEIVHSDILKLDGYNNSNDVKFNFPPASNQRFDAVFMSPPWGGTGYNQLEEYSLEHIYPNFSDIIDKTSQFSPNLIIFLPRNTSIKELIQKLLPWQHRLQGDNRLADLHSGIKAKDYQETVGKYMTEGVLRTQELTIEVERIMMGDSCTAICVYTGDLVNVKPKQVAQQFIEEYCAIYDQPSFGGNKKQGQAGGNAQGINAEGNQSFQSNSQCQAFVPMSKSSKTRSFKTSSNSSIKSGSSRGSGRNSSNQTHEVDYMIQLLTNVVQHSGYIYLSKYMTRTGKAKLSLQKVVKQMQAQFSKEDWYYIRKIHKREHNYFLDKGGQLGSSGGGWMGLSDKPTKSKQSDSQTSPAAATSSNCLGALSGMSSSNNNMQEHRDSYEEIKSQNSSNQQAKAKIKIPHMYDNSVNLTGAFERASQSDTNNFEMINEEESAEEDRDDRQLKKNLMKLGAISEGSQGGSSDEEKLKDDSAQVNQKLIENLSGDKKALVQLKDLSEERFLELIESKNQDKRFYGWLKFEPIFAEIDTVDDPVAAAHRQILDAEEILDFFGDLDNLCFDEQISMQDDNQFDELTAKKQLSSGTK